MVYSVGLLTCFYKHLTRVRSDAKLFHVKLYLTKPKQNCTFVLSTDLPNTFVYVQHEVPMNQTKDLNTNCHERFR